MGLLGIDVGITGCKAVAFSLEGDVIASAYREYPLQSPRPGWMELDVHQVTAAIQTVIREVAAHTQHDPIRVLSASSQGEAAVPISRDGELLYNTPVSFDGRTTEIAEEWTSRISAEEMFEITGMPLHPMHTIFRAMWLRDHEPEVFQRIHKLLCYEEYVFYLLGVDPVTDYSLAARTMAFDVRTKQWSDCILKQADLNVALFPDVAPSGTAIGTVSRKAADELGLPHGVVVATGGHDQPCNALGSGIIRPGMAAYGIGTVECITPTFEQPATPEAMLRNHFACYPHVVQGLQTTVAFNFTGGSLLRWYRDTFGDTEKAQAARKGLDPYEVILADLPEEPVRPMILPHFTMTGTPYFDERAKGAVLGLTLDTGRKEIVKAILEGVTFEMKLNAMLLEQAGVPIHVLRVTGGGAKSRKWVQLKADILDRPMVTLQSSEGTAMGTAMLAGVACGAYPSTQAAVEHLIKVKETFEPNPEKVRIYSERFKIYEDLYPTLKAINHRL